MCLCLFLFYVSCYLKISWKEFWTNIFTLRWMKFLPVILQILIIVKIIALRSEKSMSQIFYGNIRYFRNNSFQIIFNTFSIWRTYFNSSLPLRFFTFTFSLFLKTLKNFFTVTEIQNCRPQVGRDIFGGKKGVLQRQKEVDGYIIILLT